MLSKYRGGSIKASGCRGIEFRRYRCGSSAGSSISRTSFEPRKEAEEETMILTSHFDANGHFIHPCCKCGKEAVFGSDVSLRSGKLGTWHCGECNPIATVRGNSNAEAELRAALPKGVPPGATHCQQCGQRGAVGYRKTAGDLVWFCEEHRLAKFWADAKA